MKKFRFGLIGLGLAGLVAGTSGAQQATPSDEVFFVRTVTCEEVLRGTAEDSAYAFVFLYGYVAGELNKDTQTTLEIETTIKAARVACEASPTATALSVFRDVMSKG